MTDEVPVPVQVERLASLKFAPGPHEEEAWIAFAAHALAGYASHPDARVYVTTAVRLAANAADLMLDELRERRQP